MVKSWGNALDQKKKISAIFMNLSKALGTIDHRLMILKLGEYCCSKDSLKLILSYLKNRKQITINENPYSFQKEIIANLQKL